MKQLNWYQIFGNTHKIPDGATVLPTDDIQIWLHCANIWDKTYTTLAEVLADTTTLLALINSPNAVDYMVRSTTWAVSSALVPKMTSNTTPSGICSASTVNGGDQPYKAFDDDSENSGWHSTSGVQQWIEYEFPIPTVVSMVKIHSASNVGGPKVSTVQGSNDGVHYTDIGSFPNVPTNTWVSQSYSNATPYKRWRLNITDSNANYVYIKTMQFYSASITDNATAMSYIGLNNHCANTLLADTTWREAICQSEYFESVLNVKVPTMTSNTTPSGVCSASSTYSSSYSAWKAFDGKISTHWSSTESDSTNAWIQYQFINPVKIYAVYLNITYDSGLCCKSASVQASNDGSTFTELLAKQTFPNSSTDEYTLLINPTSAYSYYRLAEMGTYRNDVDLDVVQFYGREDV
jgi:hypothetical protein